MAEKNTATKTGEPKPKKAAKPNPLKAEVARVAKATGLPTSYVNKQLGAERKRINDDRKAAMDGLVGSVAGIVQESLAKSASAAAPPTPPEGEAAAPLV